MAPWAPTGQLAIATSSICKAPRLVDDMQSQHCSSFPHFVAFLGEDSRTRETEKAGEGEGIYYRKKKVGLAEKKTDKASGVRVGRQSMRLLVRMGQMAGNFANQPVLFVLIMACPAVDSRR